jgi:hypothetical protein
MVHGRRENKRLQVRTIEVLWKTKQDLVNAEITRMIDEDGRTEPRFQLRTSASKKVLGELNQQELKELKAAREQMAENGYTEEHKRR